MFKKDAVLFFAAVVSLLFFVLVSLMTDEAVEHTKSLYSELDELLNLSKSVFSPENRHI